MTKIIFLDIDGPMIPQRAFLLSGHFTEAALPWDVSKFDPIAVAMLNTLCDRYGWKIVIHSSRIKFEGGKKTFLHCVDQGIEARHFHEHSWCDEDENWRFTRIAKWLKEHHEIDEYTILEDTKYARDEDGYPHPNDIEKHIIVVDFNNGLTWENYERILNDSWKTKPQIDSVIDYANV